MSTPPRRRPDLIVHLGMQKSGSSALQSCLSQIGNWESDGIEYSYLDWRVGPQRAVNHSLPFQRGFGSLTGPLIPDELAGIDDDEVELSRLAHESLRSLDAELSRLGPRRCGIISAEALSGPRHRSACLAFANQVTTSVRNVTGVLYVRPLNSLLASSVQQRLRGGRLLYEPGLDELFDQPVGLAIGRRYLEDAFGADSILYRRYDRAQFPGGDIVADFAALCGFSLPADRPERLRENPALSAEATAVLYAYTSVSQDEQRKPPAYRLALADHAGAVALLKELGSTRFAFTNRLIAEVVDRWRPTIDDMEDQFGFPIVEEFGDEPAGAIDGTIQLLELAAEQVEALRSLIIAQSAVSDVSDLLDRELAWVDLAPDPLEKIRRLFSTAQAGIRASRSRPSSQGESRRPAGASQKG